MSDKLLTVANGRVVFGIKELMLTSGLIFTAGGGWWMLKANSEELTTVKRQVAAVDAKAATDHETVIGMGKDVERLVDDVSEIKTQQQKMSDSSQRQEIILEKLLASLTVTSGRHDP